MHNGTFWYQQIAFYKMLNVMSHHVMLSSETEELLHWGRVVIRDGDTSQVLLMTLCLVFLMLDYANEGHLAF